MSWGKRSLETCEYCEWKARIVCEQHFISLKLFDEPGGKRAFEMRHSFLYFFSLVRTSECSYAHFSYGVCIPSKACATAAKFVHQLYSIFQNNPYCQTPQSEQKGAMQVLVCYHSISLCSSWPFLKSTDAMLPTVFPTITTLKDNNVAWWSFSILQGDSLLVIEWLRASRPQMTIS